MRSGEIPFATLGYHFATLVNTEWDCTLYREDPARSDGASKDGGYFASLTGAVFQVVTHDSGLVLEIAGQSFPLKPQRPLEYRVGALAISSFSSL
jgi:hypothetical protein